VSERSNQYEVAPPVGATQDSEILYAVTVSGNKFVGGLQSVVEFIVDVGLEATPVELTADTL
jgi:hypothetical protein